MTETQLKAAVEIAAAVALVIKTLGSIPEGELYAHVMGHLDIHRFESVLNILVRQKLVDRRNHLLTWIGGN